MKQFLKIVVLFIILLTSNYAQSQKGSWEIGINNGILYSSSSINSKTQYFYNIPPHSSSFSLFNGLAINKQVSKKVILKSGISYFRNTTIVKDLEYTDFAGNNLGKGDASFQINYLSIPIDVQTFFDNAASGFGLSAGLSFNLLTSAKVKVVLQNNSPSVGKEQVGDNTSAYNKFNLSLVLGPTYRYKLNDRFTLTADVLLNLGMLNIANSSEISQKVRSLGAYIGFRYALNK